MSFLFLFILWGLDVSNQSAKVFRVSEGKFVCYYHKSFVHYHLRNLGAPPILWKQCFRSYKSSRNWGIEKKTPVCIINVTLQGVHMNWCDNNNIIIVFFSLLVENKWKYIYMISSFGILLLLNFRFNFKEWHWLSWISIPSWNDPCATDNLFLKEK